MDVAVIWQVSSCDASNWANPPSRWVPTASVTADGVAESAYGRLETGLPAPAVGADPPVDKFAIITFPTFVTVQNWAPFSVSESAGGITVTMTAAPVGMTYTPGEPDSAPISCAGPGVRYDPYGGPLAAQAAAPGACTWPYQHRTGADGRPPTWPASVAVQWQVAWSASSGETGSFPSMTTTTPIARDVVEVQTVVTGGELG